MRIESRRFLNDSHAHLISARNAEELRKAAEQLKDQPAVAASLEDEAKEDAAQAQADTQTANTDKYSAKGLEGRAKAAWAAAEKLDPETHKRVAPASPAPVVSQPRQVR